MQSSSEGGGGWRRPIEQSSQHFVNLPEDISRVRLHNSQHLISIILYTACWRSKSATCNSENVQTQSKRTVFPLWLPSTKIKSWQETTSKSGRFMTSPSMCLHCLTIYSFGTSSVTHCKVLRAVWLPINITAICNKCEYFLRWNAIQTWMVVLRDSMICIASPSSILCSSNSICKNMNKRLIRSSLEVGCVWQPVTSHIFIASMIKKSKIRIKDALTWRVKKNTNTDYQGMCRRPY